MRTLTHFPDYRGEPLANDTVRRVTEARENARVATAKAQARNERYARRSEGECPWKVGDLAWLHCPQVGRDTEGGEGPCSEGACQVCETFEPGSPSDPRRRHIQRTRPRLILQEHGTLVDFQPRQENYPLSFIEFHRVPVLRAGRRPRHATTSFTLPGRRRRRGGSGQCGDPAADGAAGDAAPLGGPRWSFIRHCASPQGAALRPRPWQSEGVTGSGSAKRAGEEEEPTTPLGAEPRPKEGSDAILAAAAFAEPHRDSHVPEGRLPAAGTAARGHCDNSGYCLTLLVVKPSSAKPVVPNPWAACHTRGFTHAVSHTRCQTHGTGDQATATNAAGGRTTIPRWYTRPTVMDSVTLNSWNPATRQGCRSRCPEDEALCATGALLGESS
ncbi:unnamed protein product [Lampetra planeri]